MSVWIIGQKTILPNGHWYMTEPFIAFETEAQAKAACDMVDRVSGERPEMTSAPLYREGESMSHSPTRDPQ